MPPVRIHSITNVPGKRVAQASKLRIPTTFLMLYLSTTMPPPKSNLLPQNEADIQLAISAVKSTQILHVRRAASAFNIPESMLRDRRAGKPARRNCQPNSKKLTQLEEKVIVQHILHLDQRGFAPTYAVLRDMANKLLDACGAGQVEQKWPANFVRRT
jgi:hypothetical protein